MLVPGEEVGRRVDRFLLVLVPRTEMLDDVPTVDGARPEEFGTIPGMVLLVAVVTDSIPVVTKMQEVGLVPGHNGKTENKRDLVYKSSLQSLDQGSRH